ncbi:hypothetical protein DMUE_2426 [Dictyocoela muelleri]|nr:hypothetical protein DMUE_2426 [Dictyocoela muelleri]
MYKNLLSLFRTKIGKYVEKEKRTMGGVLKEVQIDESFWTRRKYGVGRLVEAVWIWGAVKKKTGYCFLKQVKTRDVQTLLHLIKNNIKSKSYVVSDKWADYREICEYFRDSVCHKYNFIDPETKSNTQCIENLWAHLKKIKHYSYWININSLQDHLNTFMFFNHKNIEFAEYLDIILD